MDYFWNTDTVSHAANAMEDPRKQIAEGKIAFGPPVNAQLGVAERCRNVNCGEGGCYIFKGRSRCGCVDGGQSDPPWPEPDEEGRCPPKNITHPIDTEGGAMDLHPVQGFRDQSVHEKMFNTPFHPVAANPTELTETSSEKHLPDENNAERLSLSPLHVVLPVAITVILMSTLFFVFLYLRKRRVVSRTPKNDSPVSWLHRRESAFLLEHLTVLSKNPNYFAPDLDSTILASMAIKHIPQDNLKLMDEIGEGAFGKVYRGEILVPEGRTSNVAVKILKEDVSRETRDDFKREVEIMSSFDHENILQLIGVITVAEESPYMVFEYMEHGDLTELLRRTDPYLQMETKINLKQHDLVDTATQIANGMVYLTSKHFIHRDLATRNCLVGKNLVVKIADFGMSRDIYTCDYYKIGGSRMLPVRWMSPESIKYGHYTNESDAWAFGVVLWEIFSYGKQPYYGHSNEEVIKFLEDGILLQKPNNCPDVVYHVMLGCWRKDPRERFSFERTHQFLSEYSENILRKDSDMSSDCGITVHMFETDAV